MDPSRNLALQNSKLQIILQQAASRPGLSAPQGSSLETDITPPPAYHTVVDPTDSDHLYSMRTPYDPFDEEDDKTEDVPEITINTATQIRGHGNIISIAQLDSMRIAHILSALMYGNVPPESNVPSEQAQHQAQAQPHHQSQQAGAERKSLPKINITINCGATVIGDRNIVGPGLGDIARHIQIAQQRQQQQRQQQQQAQQQGQGQHPALGIQIPIQAPLPTPPMSRSSSFGSEGATGAKRKAGEEKEKEVPVKRAR